MARKTKPEQAREEVARLEQTVNGWETTAETVARRIADLETSRGREILDAGEEGPDRAREIARQLAELRDERETAAATAQAARDDLTEARRSVLRADAEQLRTEAAEKRAEADKRQKTTDGLLAKLRDYEGAGYLPMAAATSVIHGDAASPELVQARTRTDRLRHEANKLDGEAWALELEADGTAFVMPTSGRGLNDVSLLANPLKRAQAIDAARTDRDYLEVVADPDAAELVAIDATPTAATSGAEEARTA